MPKYRPKVGKYGSYLLHSDGRVEERRTRVAEKYFHQNIPVEQIALEENVSVPTIYRDIDTIRIELYESRLARASDWLNQQLAKLDFIEEQAMEAWFRSIGQAKKTQVRRDGAGAVIEQLDVSEDTIGDPRFLVQMQSVIDRRAKLLGLDAPQTLVVDTMESRVINLIREGRITFDMLMGDVGFQVAARYFNLAGQKVPTIVDGEYKEYDDEEEGEEDLP
jgi:hypothetical protein